MFENEKTERRTKRLNKKKWKVPLKSRRGDTAYSSFFSVEENEEAINTNTNTNTHTDKSLRCERE